MEEGSKHEYPGTPGYAPFVVPYQPYTDGFTGSGNWKRMNTHVVEKILSKPSKYWDNFYRTHQNRFYKNRNYLLREFTELADHINTSKRTSTLLEVGCGVGNTILPVLETAVEMWRQNPRETENVDCSEEQDADVEADDPRDSSQRSSSSACRSPLVAIACDFSAVAVSVLQQHDYFSKHLFRAFQCDISQDGLLVEKSRFEVQNVRSEACFSFPVQFATCIFVLSAIPPERQEIAVKGLYNCVAEDGLLFFRDYIDSDLAMQRLPKRQQLEGRLYTRGEGTLAYYFRPEEVRSLFLRVGFTIERETIVEREIHNRKTSQHFDRRWLQIVCRKRAKNVHV